MTILITRYAHSKITALALRLLKLRFSFSHLYILDITENPLTYKALHFKAVMEHPVAKQKGISTP